MASGSELRAHPRHRIPVVIDAPALSDIPLLPEDVSAGGFCVVSLKKPVVGESFTCSIRSEEEAEFGSCVGEAVWIRERPGDPPSWGVGIAVKPLGGDRARLNLLLQKLSEHFGVAILPY
ncbi:MAG: PilZ domain-containing protein [Nitrospinota bacterium]